MVVLNLLIWYRNWDGISIWGSISWPCFIITLYDFLFGFPAYIISAHFQKLLLHGDNMVVCYLEYCWSFKKAGDPAFVQEHLPYSNTSVSLSLNSIALFFFFNLFAPGRSCSMWALVPWSGMKPGPPALETWSVSHWTTREVPTWFLIDMAVSFQCMTKFTTNKKK